MSNHPGSDPGNPDSGKRPRFGGPPPVPGGRPAPAAEEAWRPQAPPPPTGTWKPAPPPPPGYAPAPPVDEPPVAIPVPQESVGVRVRKPLRTKRSSDMGGLLALFVMLLTAAGGLGYYMLWRQQQQALETLREAALRAEQAAVPPEPSPVEPPPERPQRGRARPDSTADSKGSGALEGLLGADTDANPADAKPARPKGAAAGRPAPRPMPDTPRAGAATPDTMAADTTVPDRSMSGGSGNSARPNQPPPPAPEAAVPPSPPADVEAALQAAYAAMCGGKFDDAAARLGTVSGGSDRSVDERLKRWQRLLEYARGYADLRTKAYRAAAGGREYDLGDRVIVVIEMNEDTLVYKDSGKNKRVPRNEVPTSIDRAIVEQWLGSDGRAANHLFLGASHLVKERPSPADASREWQRAAAGGEPDGRMLEPLVEDPVIVGGR